MEFEKELAVVEAMLFSTGSIIRNKDIMSALEIGDDKIQNIIQTLKLKYEKPESGIELVKVEDGYQLCTKKELYEYIYPLFDNRSKPVLSNSALETLAIIAYNPKITRAQIEGIRGVSSDGAIYKLQEFNLIEKTGKLDAPGRPGVYEVTPNFLKMFGISNLDELPELPRYKLDENEQIVIDDIIEEEQVEETETLSEDIDGN
jgi:segregation and condensation protein B